MDWNLKEAGEAIRPDVIRVGGALLGAVGVWWAGLSAMAQALLIVQGADVATGLLCAICARSPKSESGRVSSKALMTGVIKKGLEWLVVGICAVTGEALEMKGIAGAAMMYMMTTELVSLMENLSLFGLDIPLLGRLLDVAHEKSGAGSGRESGLESEKEV